MGNNLGEIRSFESQVPNSNTSYSTQRDRHELGRLMQIWSEYRPKFTADPKNEIEILGFTYNIIFDLMHNRLIISCNKYTWIEDYAPEYITTQFSSGSRF